MDEDHPRVCGEKTRRLWKRRNLSGSPPRVRGKGVSSAINGGISRITPRVCGEKAGARIAAIIRSGSPPRVRGKERKRGGVVAGSGSTPACAGKSYAHDSIYTAIEDHPRVCGEKPIMSP